MAYTTINKSTSYFNTKLYTGTGSSNAITGVGFQPDWTWIKNRDTTGNHALFNSISGVTKYINSNTNYAEQTSAQTLTAFGTDGFTVGTSADLNGNGNNVASWNWKAGTTGSGTTAGGGTGKAYSYSVNTTAGFSIVKWIGNGSAGHAIPHHLGAVPATIILKTLDQVGDPLVYHHKNTAAPETEFLRLKSTNATQDEAAIWNDTAPTSTYFYTGTEATVNGNNNNFIAYCFAEKAGYSKFGSYTGNGNADGAFIYTGFKPAWLLVKRTNDTQDWQMFDNKINPFNVATLCMRPNQNNGEQTGNAMDLLSNGFKNRLTGTSVNADGSTYVYMAFGQSIVGSNNVVATAR
tara:strand:+ start:1496 stop:2542 length:1047 start_codon:yes stop_codon:yes gene_type:complete